MPYPGDGMPVGAVSFVSREPAVMPAVRVRGHGFASVLRQRGIPAAVFSFADDLQAPYGAGEHALRAVDKTRLNIRAAAALLRGARVIVLQRFHYHAAAPLLVAALGRRPLVFDLDDWEARENGGIAWHGLPHSKVEWGLRWCARQSRGCVAASRFLAAYLAPYQRTVLYIPTGVDPDVFYPGPECEARPFIRVSWVGTIHRPDNVENIRFLLAVFRAARFGSRDVRLEIVGDGIYAPRVRQCVARLADNRITYCGWRPPSEMPAYLRACDIGVMPLIQKSMFNQAKSPTRLFEYMASGVPVLASCYGEAASILQNGENGLLAENRREFVAALEALVRQPALRCALGRAARATVKRSYALPELVTPLWDHVRRLL